MSDNLITGDLSSLPSTLTYYLNFGQNTTTGDLSSLPKDLKKYKSPKDTEKQELLDEILNSKYDFSKLAKNPINYDEIVDPYIFSK